MKKKEIDNNDKERLDILLVKRNLAPSREKAKAMIMAGNVFVDGSAGRTRPELHFPVRMYRLRYTEIPCSM